MAAWNYVSESSSCLTWLRISVIGKSAVLIEWDNLYLASGLCVTWLSDFHVEWLTEYWYRVRTYIISCGRQILWISCHFWDLVNFTWKFAQILSTMPGGRQQCRGKTVKLCAECISLMKMLVAGPILRVWFYHFIDWKPDWNTVSVTGQHKHKFISQKNSQKQANS